MRAASRFPFTIAAAAVVTALVGLALTGELDVIDFPIRLLDVNPRAFDDVVGSFVILACAVAVDIARSDRAAETQRRRETEEQEARFRLLFADNPLPMWVYDLQTLRFLEVNVAALQKYEYAREEFLEMTIQDIRTLDDVSRLMAQLENTRTPLERAGGWRHRSKSGAIIDVEITSHTITFTGRPAALVVAQDVSERKRLEAQFQQSQKMEAIGQLAGGVAHDFNNLLTVILGCCEFMLDDEAAPKRDDVVEIQRAGQDAVSLTRQLLAFSRRELIQPTVLDLNTVVKDTTRMLKRLIGANNDLELLTTPELDLIKVDAGQLSQVLVNLVVNARDAMMPAGGKLTIETKNVELDDRYAGLHFAVIPGAYVMLAVSDTGSGIPPELQSRIFEPFFTTKDAGKGTGLGLASVYGIVKQNGGNIWLYSERGQGTTFKLYFPRVAETLRKTATPARVVEKKHWETILVVDDNPSLRAMTVRMLERDGYSVLSAGSADEALELFRQYTGPIHLLLTDIIMPGLSGPSLAANVAGERPEMRVLCMSGYAADAVVRHGVLEGQIPLLPKPFSAAVLIAKVEEVLNPATPG